MNLPPAEIFGAPLAGLLLLPIALGGWLLVRSERRREQRLLDVVGPRAAALASERSPARVRLSLRAGIAGMLLCTLACMQPRFGRGPTRELPPGLDLCVCLDVSRSMLAADLQPSRLAFAVQAIIALAGRTRGDRLALVLFAGEARLRVPLTRDVDSFVEIVRGVDPSDVTLGGTDLGGAIETGTAALARAQQRDTGGGDDAQLRGALLLVTDGEDPNDAGRAAAAAARARGLRVHSVGLGSALGSKIAIPGPDGRETFLRDLGGNEVVSRLDATSLRAIAVAGNGLYTDGASSTTPLVDLYERAIVPELGTLGLVDADGQTRANRFQLPLAAGIVVLLLDLLLPQRRRRREQSPPLLVPTRAGGAT